MVDPMFVRLYPGGAFNFVIRFRPNSIGGREGLWRLAKNGAIQMVRMRGVGNPPQVTFSPNSLELGAILIGDSASSRCTISNMSLISLECSLSSSPDLNIQSSLGFSLPPGSSTEIEIVLREATPVIGGRWISVIMATTGYESCHTIQVACDVVFPELSVVESVDLSLNTSFNQDHLVPLRVHNPGHVPLDLILQLDSTGEEQIYLDTASVILKPSESGQIVFRYSPTIALCGPSSAQLKIYYRGCVIRTVTVTGSCDLPNLQISPEDLLFSFITSGIVVHNTIPIHVAVKNVSDSLSGSVRIGCLDGYPSDRGVSVAFPKATVTIPPNSAETIELQLSVSKMGAFSIQHIYLEEMGRVPANRYPIHIFGNCVGPSIGVVALDSPDVSITAVDFANVPCNSRKARELTIFNKSGVAFRFALLVRDESFDATPRSGTLPALADVSVTITACPTDIGILSDVLTVVVFGPDDEIVLEYRRIQLMCKCVSGQLTVDGDFAFGPTVVNSVQPIAPRLVKVSNKGHTKTRWMEWKIPQPLATSLKVFPGGIVEVPPLTCVEFGWFAHSATVIDLADDVELVEYSSDPRVRRGAPVTPAKVTKHRLTCQFVDPVLSVVDENRQALTELVLEYIHSVDPVGTSPTRTVFLSNKATVPVRASMSVTGTEFAIGDPFSTVSIPPMSVAPMTITLSLQDDLLQRKMSTGQSQFLLIKNEENGKITKLRLTGRIQFDRLAFRLDSSGTVTIRNDSSRLNSFEFFWADQADQGHKIVEPIAGTIEPMSQLQVAIFSSGYTWTSSPMDVKLICKTDTGPSYLLTLTA